MGNPASCIPVLYMIGLTGFEIQIEVGRGVAAKPDPSQGNASVEEL
jgi:hypothetical protein